MVSSFRMLLCLCYHALSLPLDRVNVKATTTERLAFEGREEGISAQAVCMVTQA